MAAATAGTLLFVVGEALAGWRAHSLALFSDAGHNFADAAALALSWYAMVMARRRATSTMTFGYHRIGVLAALVNAASLIVIGGLIFWEAAERLRNPEPVDATLMIVVGGVAVALNLVISLWLRPGRDDLNVRSAYVHMIGDALSAGGVVVAGVAVRLTGTHRVDAAVSFLIGVLIIWSSWDILRESVTVLLEGVPAEIDVESVQAALRQIPGVANVHHVHAWTITSGFLACSCHVVPDATSAGDSQRLLEQADRVLKERFKFRHTTIQIETGDCTSEERGCADRHGEATHEH